MNSALERRVNWSWLHDLACPKDQSDQGLNNMRVQGELIGREQISGENGERAVGLGFDGLRRGFFKSSPLAMSDSEGSDDPGTQKSRKVARPKKNVVSEAGVIKTVELINFMCHSYVNHFLAPSATRRVS